MKVYKEKNKIEINEITIKDNDLILKKIIQGEIKI